MTGIDRRTFLTCTAAACAALRSGGAASADTAPGKFICPPCGCSMDGRFFDAPGTCPACEMSLAPASEFDLGFEPTILPPGGGRFEVRGGKGREERRITAHYFRPERYTPVSDILFVVPGAGRNSASYRNAWLGHSIDTGTFVAALGYPEADYDFAAYHLGGVASDVEWRNARIEDRGRSRIVRLRDEDIELEINADAASWLFPDFDRLFDFTKAATRSRQPVYSLFGHSAGAQVLHRMALLHPSPNVDRIIAANAGFYTLPDLDLAYPLGLSGTGAGRADLERAFGVELTLLLGELDNDEDAGGTLLRTPSVDRQGLGRLDRGRSFHQAAQHGAERLGVPLRWNLQVVPGVGHDHRGMSEAAGNLLTRTRGHQL